MNKVMNNLKKLSNSTVIQSVNENVIPSTYRLKNYKTPVVKHFGGFFVSAINNVLTMYVQCTLLLT